MYKLVIFDIDGTLMDTEKAIICALQELLEEEKRATYEVKDLQFILGLPGKETLKRLEITDIDAAMQKWDNYLSKYISLIKLFPGIESLLKQLKANKTQTGIVTSKTKHELQEHFKPFGLNKYFNNIICADDTIRHKPNPEPLLKCIDITQILPSEAIYIGDTIYDSQCASSAGVDFALALWGTKDENIKSEFKLSDPLEILNII